MLENVKKYCEDRIKEFDQIPTDRKQQLLKISKYVNEREFPKIIFVCTHNSRRSQLSQVWASIAADYYRVKSAHFYSAGTEATAFHKNAIEALKRAGLKVGSTKKGQNPNFLIDFGGEKPIKCFSKMIDHESLPKSNFAAVMTCGHAEENCPFLPGADLRIPITYEDPKISDGTPHVKMVYDERCAQIAREVLYVLSKVY
ncbi:MAG: low molecular weight phosphatase family protein [Bacteroidota bacterium]